MNRRDPLGLLGLVLFVLVAIVPIGFSLGYAVAYSVGAVGLLSEGVTAAHWAKLFTDTEIWASFGLSVYVAVVAVVLSVGGALFLALYLRRPLQTGVLAYAIYFPLAIPATVAAFLVFQLLAGGGLAVRLALALGLIGEAAAFPGLVNDAWAVGIIVAHIGLALPFFVLLFGQLYEREKIAALTDVARTLGAGRAATLYRVAVPILLRQAFTNIALLFIFILGSYEVPLLLGRQAPQMVSVLTMRKYALFDLSEKPEAFVIAILYTVLVLGLIGWVFRRRRAVTRS